MRDLRNSIVEGIMTHKDTVPTDEVEKGLAGLDVPDLVEKKVANFAVEKLEALILDVASRGLRAIEVLGGVLGVLIGAAQVGFLFLPPLTPLRAAHAAIDPRAMSVRPSAVLPLFAAATLLAMLPSAAPAQERKVVAYPQRDELSPFRKPAEVHAPPEELLRLLRIMQERADSGRHAKRYDDSGREMIDDDAWREAYRQVYALGLDAGYLAQILRRQAHAPDRMTALYGSFYVASPGYVIELIEHIAGEPDRNIRQAMLPRAVEFLRKPAPALRRPRGGPEARAAEGAAASRQPRGQGARHPARPPGRRHDAHHAGGAVPADARSRRRHRSSAGTVVLDRGLPASR